MYVYIKSEPNRYTVGFYSPAWSGGDPEFIAESDYTNARDAARRVHYLHGGSDTASGASPNTGGSHY
jgi:hypothetical protein